MRIGLIYSSADKYLPRSLRYSLCLSLGCPGHVLMSSNCSEVGFPVGRGRPWTVMALALFGEEIWRSNESSRPFSESSGSQTLVYIMITWRAS